MAGRFISWTLALYCVALVAAVGWLSHHPWPRETLEEPVAPAPPPPPDFKAIVDIDARKAAFFDYLLPIIEAENQRLHKSRDQLLTIIAKVEAGTALSAREQQQIARWAQTYEVEEAPIAEMLERLERRINGLPPAMVLAQAAAESAWGTSRFARQGYNYFGQWCFTAGCGLVPKRRPAGAIHEVTRFDSPQASVAAYFHNLNTHSAYHGLRLLRQEFHRRGSQPSAYELVGKLRSYSERGEAYIEEIRAIIRANELENDVPEESAPPSEAVTAMAE